MKISTVLSSCPVTHFCLILLIFFSTLSFITVQTANGTAARPFPQHTTYAAGTIKPSNFTQAQLDSHVENYYASWKTRFLVQVSPVPLSQYRIAMDVDGGSERSKTVSEGQGYGMIILAFMAGYDVSAQSIFDGLYRFVEANSSGIDTRLMTWQVPIGTSGNDSAFDGDADIAYALLLADAQWGSTGTINYLAEALTMITAIKESTIGPDSHLPLLGDWVSPNAPDYNQYTNRPSDYMPSHFKAFYHATGDNAWLVTYDSVQNSIATLQQNHSPIAGLLPDFIEPVSSTDHTPRPADPNFLEGSNDGKYYYNSGRVPFRIGVDALLSNNQTSMGQAQKIANWIVTSTEGNPDFIKAGYSLTGAMIGSYFTTFFASPFGVALMTTSSHQTYLNNLYSKVYILYEGYFEDSINLLCLLVMSGNYWDSEKSNSSFLPAVNYLLLK